MRDLIEFRQVVWPVALILLLAAAPLSGLVWHFCFRWMTPAEEPGQGRIENVHPISSTAQAGRPGGF